jgi:hypothetical protein
MANFNHFDANHDGVISREEFAAMAAPVTTVSYGAPVAYAAPVTYAAPAIQVMPQPRAVQQVIPSDRRLYAGAVIGEMNVTREQLISQGRLIPDDQREAQIMQQTSGMPGYMPYGHNVGVPISNYIDFQQAKDPIYAGVRHGQGGQVVQPGSHHMPQHAVNYGGPQHAAPKDCEWMFGDAATGILGFHMLAHLDPLRWSGSKTFQQAISDLEQVCRHGTRPIIVKAPSGVMSKENHFKTPQEAIAFLQQYQR